MPDRLPLWLRLAVRSLWRRPAFSLLAVLILALGIGANGTVFSVLDATLLRPLPFREPDRLVSATLTVPAGQDRPARDDMVWSWPKYQTFASLQRSFAATEVWSGGGGTLLAGESAVRLTSEDVSGGYFAALGIRPALGRFFDTDEGHPPEAPRVVVLSHRLWRSQFGGDPGVIGVTVQFGGAPATVIGVAPAGFTGLSGLAELWLNIASSNAEQLQQPWSHSYNLVARLAPGVTMAAGLAEAEALGAAVDAAHPAPIPGQGTWGVLARPLEDIRADPTIGRTVVVLSIAIGLVLLIACVNLANLLLARALGRQREIAVCLAIGARRRHIVQSLLAESVILGLAGGVTGLLLTWGATVALANQWAGMAGTSGVRFGGLTTLGLGRIGVSPGVVAFLAATTALVAILVGLLPALRSSRPELTAALKGGSGHERAGGGRISLRDALVTAQLAMAITLLVGAGLMIRSMGNLLATDAGVDADRVATARLALAAESYQPDSASGFYGRLLERVSALPGVTAAAVGNCPPLNGGCNGTVIWFRDRPEVPPGEEPLVGIHTVSPGFFQTLGIRLVRGRDFSSADRRGTPHVAIINEAAARKFYPNEDPIGRPIAVGQSGFHVGSAEIIGIVSDVRFGTLEEEPVPDVFIPYLQAPRPAAILFVRTAGPSAPLLPPLRALLRELDPTMPVYDIRTMPDRMALATVRPRYTTGVLGGFALAALLLAAVGIYALLAYEVTQRRREIGIRMALGAATGTVVRGVVRRGITLALAGILVGLPLAFALSRFLGSLLYQVAPDDPMTFAGISFVLMAVALLATVVPARSATRVDPLEAIRSE